jgi:hypothetical protein
MGAGRATRAAALWASGEATGASPVQPRTPNSPQPAPVAYWADSSSVICLTWDNLAICKVEDQSAQNTRRLAWTRTCRRNIDLAEALGKLGTKGPAMPTTDEQNEFLEKDLPDALKWLFVGAVVWQAAQEKPEKCCHQEALGMFMSSVQARALYEFYYSAGKTGRKGGKADDARAREFCNTWAAPDSIFYRNYYE